MPKPPATRQRRVNFSATLRRAFKFDHPREGRDGRRDNGDDDTTVGERDNVDDKRLRGWGLDKL